MSIVWCLDSPGFGGSEINLGRVWQMLGVGGQYVLHARSTAEEMRALFRDRHMVSIEDATPSSMSHAAPGLRRAFRRLRAFPNEPFVIWCHHPDTHRWLQLALALASRDFVVVEQIVPASREELRRSRLTAPIKRFVAARARAVVVNGHSQAAHYRHLFDLRTGRLVVIPNSRPVAEIGARVQRLRTDRIGLRRSLALPDRPTILCLARLAAQKDQSTLIRAVAALGVSPVSPQLVLVGDGPDRDKLTALAAQLLGDRVLFAGRQSDPVPWLAAADLFVLPSLSEGLPGALIEAMAAELPCVASDIPGNRELVQDGRTGFSFPVGDHERLARAISELLTGRDLPARFARAAYERVRSCYDESIERAAWQRFLLP